MAARLGGCNHHRFLPLSSKLTASWWKCIGEPLPLFPRANWRVVTWKGQSDAKSKQGNVSGPSMTNPKAFSKIWLSSGCAPLSTATKKYVRSPDPCTSNSSALQSPVLRRFELGSTVRNSRRVNGCSKDGSSPKSDPYGISDALVYTIDALPILKWNPSTKPKVTTSTDGLSVERPLLWLHQHDAEVLPSARRSQTSNTKATPALLHPTNTNTLISLQSEWPLPAAVLWANTLCSAISAMSFLNDNMRIVFLHPSGSEKSGRHASKGPPDSRWIFAPKHPGLHSPLVCFVARGI